jgi:radical SAM superfamily enzyme YgiQ (UPF0313 family)
MKVLIISTNTLPASPSGSAYIAGAVRQAGHEVAVYDCLFAIDLASELVEKLAQFQPDVVGISIRLVFGDTLDPSAPLGTRHVDLRPHVREIVDIVRRNSIARIVLGGPGFNYYAQDWLDYLDVDYGIRGEGEVSFPLFLQRLAQDGDLTSIPGCVIRENGGFATVPSDRVENWDQIALPAYDLFEMEQYAAHKISPAIFTKRGCAYACTYCPYSKLDGKRYRLKSPERVLDEIRHVIRSTSCRKIIFCDNNFNVPKPHAEALCRVMARAQLDFTWGTGDLRPVGITDHFCQLLEESGCFYANLAIESASESMLKNMKRGYNVCQVRQALEVLSRSRIPFGASLMLGAPGETPETITETLSVLDEFHIPLGVWVTIGVYLWTDYQDIVAEARRAGILKHDRELFSGTVYLSPGLPRSYLGELVEVLRAKPGYSVQFNKPNQE